jgi:hypothetical protein
VKIRVETIAHYLQKYANEIIERKKAAIAPGCPFIRRSAADTLPTEAPVAVRA